MARKPRPKRDIEKEYPLKQFVTKLRRLADALESGKRFRIQVASQRVTVPPGAIINIEHERGKKEEEIEFQLKWPVEPDAGGRPLPLASIPRMTSITSGEMENPRFRFPPLSSESPGRSGGSVIHPDGCTAPPAQAAHVLTAGTLLRRRRRASATGTEETPSRAEAPGTQ